jgi:CRP-like cAMP-binding protein
MQVKSTAGYAALSSAPLFKDIPEEARRAILASAKQVSLRKGQLLFERGDPGGTMFVVVDGMIEISLSTVEGRKISLNLMGAGSCFGEVSAMDGGDRSADATAAAPTSLLSISRNALYSCAREYPDVALALAHMLSERVRWITDSVEDYALLPLDRRLARRVLILFDRFGGKEQTIAMSQEDLADFVGATREATNKILAQWRKRGWIAMGRRSIGLLNRHELDEFAMKSQLGSVATK